MLMCSSWYLYIQAKKIFTLLQKASSEVGVCQKQLLHTTSKSKKGHMSKKPITTTKFKAKALKHVSK